MFSIAALEVHGCFFTVMDVCGLTQSDVPWLLSELVTAQNEIKRAIAEVIARRLSPDEVETFGLIMLAANVDDVLRMAIKPLVGPDLSWYSGGGADEGVP